MLYMQRIVSHKKTITEWLNELTDPRQIAECLITLAVEDYDRVAIQMILERLDGKIVEQVEIRTRLFDHYPDSIEETKIKNQYAALGIEYKKSDD